MIVALFSVEPREGLDPAVEAEEEERSARMHQIVRRMPGFISYKAYTADDGERVVVVRFESHEALAAWRSHPEHREAQQRGREAYYEKYWVQVCQTVREYSFTRDRGYEYDPGPLFAES
jgi:heme-degrading monooxygenase HmoA